MTTPIPEVESYPVRTHLHEPRPQDSFAPPQLRSLRMRAAEPREPVAVLGRVGAEWLPTKPLNGRLAGYWISMHLAQLNDLLALRAVESRASSVLTITGHEAHAHWAKRVSIPVPVNAEAWRKSRLPRLIDDIDRKQHVDEN